jgi:hypothetical protein
MQLPSFLPSDPAWQTWVVPAAGLCAALLVLFAGRFVLARRRAAAARPADEAAHDPFAHGSLSERRGTFRREGTPIEVLISDAEVTEEPVRGWVLDRSMGGLRLLLDDGVASGLVLALKPRQAPPGTPWVRVEVCSCKKEGDGFEAGCKFVRTPPWSVLLLFG